MCTRCDDFDRELKEQLDRHDGDCQDKACLVPRVEPHNSVFANLGRAYWRMAETIERIRNTRRVVDAPDLVPSQLLREWEHHLIEAAELMARARKRREADEADSYILAMANVQPKGKPS